MAGEKLYLRSNVYIEPLINQWYAWQMLIVPQTLGMVVANLHLKIMQSYIQSPSLHINAVKNPKMLGGPFIDLPGNQTKIVRELMDRTIAEQGLLFKLADAIKALDLMLSNEAKGHSLQGLYEKIPEELKGFTELGYDLNNQPSIRFIERLLYRGPYYDESRQSIALSINPKDDRAFCLSTPRFPDKRHLHYQIPFSSDAIDRLFRMKYQAQSIDEVQEFIPEDPQEREFFMSLFTETPLERRGGDRAELGHEMRVKYCGHACLLIESSEVSIMTDPLVSYEIEDKTVPRYSFEDLPETIDYVLITHGHQDHIMFETLLQLRHKIKCIVVPRSNGGTLQDPSLKLVLENTGFQNVIELDEMEELKVPSGVITGLPFFGEHADLHIRSKLAFHVNLRGKTVMCAADSNNLEPKMYDLIRKQMGPVDKLFLGMECAGAPMSWLYGPLLTKPLERRMDQSRRLDGSDFKRGMDIIESLGVKGAYVYAMGLEPWLTFILSVKYTETSKPIVASNQLVKACEEKGIEAERLFGRKIIMV